MTTQGPANADVNELLKLALDRIKARRRVPASTYRLQFHKGFTFADATAAVPYLSALGLTHAYASPYTMARPGSTHGYDVVDHNRLNPELGTEADHDALVAALAGRGMGLVLDVVPNHAGVGTNDNAWWNDVLEHGRASRFADCFDIAWDGSPRPEWHGKVLLPVLGGTYGQTLEKGELKLSLDLAAGSFRVAYYDRKFPVDPRTYPAILGLDRTGLKSALGVGHEANGDFDKIRSDAEALPTSADAAQDRFEAASAVKAGLADLLRRNPTVREHVEATVERFNGTPGDAASFDLLDDLLGRQNYRLSYWRVAPDEINYRRFFDINDLAALAMERPAVFGQAHKLVLRLVADGVLDGLRIDHPDGLYDPAGYLARLQRGAILAHAAAALDGRPEPLRGGATAYDRLNELSRALERQLPSLGTGPSRWPIPVWVEKILALDEPLIPDWATLGTSGYDFLNMANGLFVDPSAESAITDAYATLTNGPTDFHDLVYEKKKLILSISLASELRMLADRLSKLAARDRVGRDFALAALTDALREVIACFPVYRTYVSEAGVTETDVKHVERAVAEAVRRNPRTEPAIFHYIRDTLLLRGPLATNEATRAETLAFAGKFQQLTSPATAKGIEDTAFYIYNRFVSLNEVGNEPDKFGIPPARLHAYLADRQANWPHALSTLSTHDTKRSEDVRARLNVLSEIPAEWREHVTKWYAVNARHRGSADGKPAPDANEEYLIYQTLVGVWPFDEANVGPHAVVDRVQAYLLKAMREAKVNTSWTDPNGDHEALVSAFVQKVLDAKANAEFFADFRPFQKRVAWFGMINGLSQTLLRLTSPGVPDTYQGTELWDLSLVDPDNRRPVDYGHRRNLLAELEARHAAEDVAPLVADLLKSPADGRVKLFTTWRALEARRRHPGLFSVGAYTPVTVEGGKAEHAFAFAREHEGRGALVVIPRLTAKLGVAEGGWPTGGIWSDATLPLPKSLVGRTVRNAFTGEEVVAGERVPVSAALATFPVGLWVTE